MPDGRQESQGVGREQKSDYVAPGCSADTRIGLVVEPKLGSATDTHAHHFNRKYRKKRCTRLAPTMGPPTTPRLEAWPAIVTYARAHAPPQSRRRAT